MKRNALLFQVVQFAEVRSEYASFITSSEVVVKKLYLKDWTPNNGNADCSYAIYTIDQFFDVVDYARTRYT